MAKRSLALQLDEAVQAMLVSLRPRPEEAPDRELAPLVRVAQVLRELPREEFRAALKSDLQWRVFMNEGTAASQAGTGEAQARAVHYQRPGLTTITPYIIVRPAAQFMEFLKSAFEGVERMRMPAPDGSIMHAEVAVGNGAIEVSDGNEQYPTAPAAIHLYVDDADAAYERAVRAGATSIAPVADQPWGDRWGAVKDRFGNHWYIAKPGGWTPGPEGIRSVQPYLHLREADKMIPFMEAVFGAESLGVAKSPEGAVLHGTMRIGNATLEIDEAHGEFQPMPCHLHVYVPDTDAVYERALRAGATSIETPQDKPYGDRSAGVKDAFGNSWFIATYLGR
jgi:PhnB protein